MWPEAMLQGQVIRIVMTRAKVKVGEENPAFQEEGKQVKRSRGSKVDRTVDSREVRGQC